ncbi:chromosome transmission fidelity protein 18 homolog isoform X1 [Hydra vulgaris]|uniref:chromosome transmission fidelity protein 18 homolog isoform X1 n=1 Tax=Hydra vulgaris TaxID=6087 RepID=UPI001F5EE874|nr:chromosome transmission fidelity protein 18 homolog [Hydra vulgaris]
MDSFPDPEDYEEDYSHYEDQYADDFKLVNELEDEEIDFDIEKSIKVKPKMCKDLNIQFFCNNATKTHLTQAQKRQASVLGDSDEEPLKFSSDEDDDLQIKENNLKSKKLKVSDEFLQSSNYDVKHFTKKHESISSLINQLKSKNNNECLDEATSQKQHVFRRPLLGEESINVTNINGDRVFLRIKSDFHDQSRPEYSRWHSIKNWNLLSTPFEQLKQEVQDKKKMRLEEQLIINNSARDDNNHLHSKVDLWVEKYSPKRYTDLLSDDGTNRILLRWLKLWDDIVFNNGINNIKSQSVKKQFQQENISKLKENATSFPKKFDIEDELVLDAKGRPKHKVALLCGNPGLGKTTLAHVISCHAGYNIVEMNASDDRSPEIFLNKIESATQMKAVLGEQKRPNCLVIDEIDGAPVQAINTLLAIIKATDVGNVKQKGKKKQKKQLILNRPIICICNNQYVPALRELRKAALTLSFPMTVPARLANRLLNISRVEGLHIDMTSILLLCERAENDIRSCLNTLQFIRQKSKEVKPEDISSMTIGQKDLTKDSRRIVAEIFQLPHFNKKKLRSSNTNSSSRFQHILQLVSGESELDKITQGLFDHYLNTKTKDPYLESINCGCDWLEFTDFLENKISSQQEYVFLRYMTFLPVAFHMYYARSLSPKITYSATAYENYLKTTHNQQTYQMMVNGMPLQMRKDCSLNTGILDLIPFLFCLTVPNLRPVNTQLYSESEKEMLQNLINIMISYNLTYHQERNFEGVYTYQLEPNIEELTTFSGLPQHRHLPYATKQLIAREIEMEKMRRAECLTKPQGSINQIQANCTNLKSLSDVKASKIKVVKQQTSNTRTQLDFFGRTFVANSNLESNDNKEETLNIEQKQKTCLLNNTVFYRFNEGFTNAVRRTVKTHEFF